MTVYTNIENLIADVTAAYNARIAKEGADITKGKKNELDTGFRALTATVNAEFVIQHALNLDLTYFDGYAKAVHELRSLLAGLRNGAVRVVGTDVSNTTATLLKQIVYIANKRKDKIEGDKLVLTHLEAQAGLSSVIAKIDGVKFDHNKSFQTRDTAQTTGAQTSLFMTALALLGLNTKVQVGRSVNHHIDFNNTAFDMVRANVVK